MAEHIFKGKQTSSIVVDTQNDDWLFSSRIKFELPKQQAAISELDTSDGNRIVVENASIAANWGLYLRGANTVAEVRGGKIEATIGIVIVGESQTVTNSATIIAPNGSGISIGSDFGGNNTLINSGDIKAFSGIAMSANSGEVFNSGKIHASGIGIWMYDNTSLTLEERSHVVARDAAIHIDALYAGSVDIMNMGYLEGAKGRAIEAEDAAVRLENSGKIVGKVMLSSEDDTFDGRAGMLSGSLHGWAGADLLIGGKGNETIDGGEGADTIEGWRGRDRLTGGGDNDTFVFTTGFGKDVITDFGAGDKIDLSALVDFDDLADLVENHTRDTGRDVVIFFGENTLTITGAETTEWSDDQFVLG